MAEYELREQRYTKELGRDLQEEPEVVEEEQTSKLKDLMKTLMSTEAKGSITFMPAVANGIVYFGAFDGNLYALNAQTGHLLWKFRAGAGFSGGLEIADRSIYLGSLDRNFYALDAATGQELWRLNTGGLINAHPTVFRDVVYTTPYDSYLYALNRHTGEQMWRFRFNDVTSAQPLVINSNIYIGSGDGRIYAITPDGRQIWNYLASPGNPVGASVAVDKNGKEIPCGSTGVDISTSRLISACWDGNVFCLDFDGRMIWKFLMPGTFDTRWQALVSNGALYIGSGDPEYGELCAIDVRTGKQIWKKTATGRFDIPRALNGVMYVGSMDSNIYAIEMATGREVWRFRTGGTVMNPPAIAYGLIYFGSYDGNLYCLNPDGNVVWKYFIGGQQIQQKELSVWGKFSNRFKRMLTFWKPEKPVSRAYETEKPLPGAGGVSAYQTGAEPYKSEVKYAMSGPAGYQMGGQKKKDWHDLSQGRR